MKDPNVYKLPESACSYCSCAMSRALSPVPVDAEPRPPASGDISLCAECGGVNVFDDELHLRQITAQEINAIKRDFPDTWKSLQATKKVRERVMNGLNGLKPDEKI